MCGYVADHDATSNPRLSDHRRTRMALNNPEYLDVFDPRLRSIQRTAHPIFLANLLGIGQLREVRLHVTLAYPRDYPSISLSYSWKLRRPSTHRPINPAPPRVAASANRMLNKE